MSKRVLVTGGAGYIGSHTCRALANDGFTPVALDDLRTGHASSVKWGPLIIGEIGDEALVRRVIADERIEAVIHFAASAYVGESVTNPQKYFANNVAAALRLLDAVLATGTPPVIFSSTCATYGIPSELPIREDQDQRPIHPYGESKLFFEKALKAYGAAYGMKWVALRYFNAAGADPNGEIGEEHDPETHLIPNVIRAALGQLPEVSIFGDDYPTPDGTALRDYIHVSDLADAHVRALRYLQDGGESRAFNLGTGNGHSVLEVIAAVAAQAGKPVPSTRRPRRPGDPPSLIADASAFMAAVQWRPKHSDLKTIVETAWRWHTRRKEI